MLCLVSLPQHPEVKRSPSNVGKDHIGYVCLILPLFIYAAPWVFRTRRKLREFLGRVRAIKPPEPNIAIIFRECDEWVHVNVESKGHLCDLSCSGEHSHPS